MCDTPVRVRTHMPGIVIGGQALDFIVRQIALAGEVLRAIARAAL